MPDFDRAFAPGEAERGKFAPLTDAELTSLGQTTTGTRGRYAVLTYQVNSPDEVGITNVAVPVSGFVAPISSVPVIFGDEGIVDAFGRQRITDPYTIFDSKQLCDGQPLLWDTEVQGNGATNYLFDDSASTLEVSGAGDFCIRQTKMRFNYQPGKALRHGEPVLTPNGWINIEDLNAGDEVIDGLGKITKIKAIVPQGIRPIYRFTFDDGTCVDADEEHQWVTIIRQNSQKGNRRILTTKQMLDEYGSNPPEYARWRIPASPVIDFRQRHVSIDPYTLGAILGDGHISKSGHVQLISSDEEIVKHMVCEGITKYTSKYGYGINGLSEKIKLYQLEGKTPFSKFIPDDFKFNSTEVRLSILQGLMDTDGYCNRHDGCAYFYSVSEQLAEDVAFLVRSLGGHAKVKRSENSSYLNDKGQKIECNGFYKVSVIMSLCPFKLKRKAVLWKPRTQITFDRFVHSIVYLGKDEATCIQVESEDETFLTRNCIVTHNSQQILMTGVFGEQVSGVEKRIGYFNTNTTSPFSGDRDGIYFETDGVNLSVNIAKNGTINKVPQSAWNVDRLDGTGISQITLDITKAQIFFIDFEWLGVGRVRTGFVIDGQIKYCHFFKHANINNSVYMKNPNHSVRYEIYSTGGASNSMRHICASVISEGGVETTGIIRAASNSISGEINVEDEVLGGLIGIRLDVDHPYATIQPYKIGILNTSSDDLRWALVLNPIFVNPEDIVWDDIDTGCAIEAGISSTGVLNVSAQSTGIILAEGFASSDQDASNDDIQTALRVGISIDGTRDELWLCAKTVGVGNADLLGTINFKQLL